MARRSLWRKGKQLLRRLVQQPGDVWYYVQGSVRYGLLKGAPFLVRWHIRDQYAQRKIWAMQCYKAGSCPCCGCQTPQVFLASKGCGANKRYSPCRGTRPDCYGPLLSQTAWYWLKLKQLQAHVL